MKQGIQKRNPGIYGPEVSALDLGCMGMTFSFLPLPDRKDMIVMIRKAVDMKATFFDRGIGYLSQ